mgnify:CR=1 FL=1
MSTRFYQRLDCTKAEIARAGNVLTTAGSLMVSEFRYSTFHHC